MSDLNKSSLKAFITGHNISLLYHFLPWLYGRKKSTNQKVKTCNLTHFGSFNVRYTRNALFDDFRSQSNQNFSIISLDKGVKIISKIA